MHVARPLTADEAAFFELYCKLGDGREAVIRAGLAETHEEADATARSFLRRPALQQALTQAAFDQRQAMAVTPDRVLRELAAIAFADPNDFLQDELTPGSDKRVRMRPLEDIDPVKRGAIRKIIERPGPDGRMETTLELHNKLPALTALAKQLGIERAALADEAAVDAEGNIERLYEAMKATS